MIDLTIESLRSGDFRATARHLGTTIAWRDASTAKAALLAVLNEACGSHRCGNGKYDMTHLQPNAEAKAIMTEAGLIQPEAMEALAAQAGRAEVAAAIEEGLVNAGALSKGEPVLIQFAAPKPEAAGPGAGDLAGVLVEAEWMLSEACGTIPDDNKARLNVTRALGLVCSLLDGLPAARSRAIAALEAEQGPNVDKEEAHMRADKVLCGLLADLGFADVVAEWEKVDKRYA
jgi:hypothetical protein